MAVAGQRGLDPRQVKAQEEFERMREQLTRTLERNVDPTPWRERARERVAAFERENARRRPPLAAAVRSARWPWFVALGGAFALGLLTALAVALLLRPAPQATSDLAGIVIDAPAEPPPSAPAFAGQPALRPAVERASDSAAEVTPAPAPADARPREGTGLAAAATAASTESSAPASEPAAFEPALPEPAAAEPVSMRAAVAEPAPAAAAPAEAASENLLENPLVRRVALIRESQTLLAALGYVPGRADGDPGPQTLAAAALFATERGLSDSNFDPAFRAALREARAGALPILSSAEAADPVLARVERIREIQALLLAQGFELGRADGDAGPATLQAAATFAQTHGLADANLDAAFLAALREASVGALE